MCLICSHWHQPRDHKNGTHTLETTFHIISIHHSRNMATTLKIKVTVLSFSIDMTPHRCIYVVKHNHLQFLLYILLPYTYVHHISHICHMGYVFHGHIRTMDTHIYAAYEGAYLGAISLNDPICKTHSVIYSSVRD